MPARQLSGVLPPIATPVDGDGRFWKEAMKKNLSLWERTGLHGYLALGSNGEGCLFDEDEQLEILATVRENVAEQRLVFAGVNAQSARQALRFLQRASELRPTAALVLPPYYYKSAMTPAALEAYFRAVADGSPLPVMIYNMPAYTGIDIPAPVVAKLSSHPNIVGMKESGPNIVKIGEMLRDAAPGFAIFAGSGSYMYASMVLGAVGAIAAVANVAPRECVRLYELATSGRREEARALQLRLLELNKAVTTGFGIAGLKFAMELRGLAAGLPREPLQPLDEAGKAAVRRIVEEANLEPL